MELSRCSSARVKSGSYSRPVPEWLLDRQGHLSVFRHLQLVLKPGERIETAAGQWTVVGKEPIRWKADEIGPGIRHRGWALKLAPGAELAWPMFPYNPYRA